MHLQQTYIDLVSPAYHLWQTGVFLYEPRIDAYELDKRIQPTGQEIGGLCCII